MSFYPKYVFTKDGIFKRVERDGKTKTFVPIEVAKATQEVNQEADIRRIANELAEQMVAKILANLPTGSAIIKQTEDSTVSIDETIAPIKTDISDIDKPKNTEQLSEKVITKDSTLEQTRNKLKQLKGK